MTQGAVQGLVSGITTKSLFPLLQHTELDFWVASIVVIQSLYVGYFESQAPSKRFPSIPELLRQPLQIIVLDHAIFDDSFS